MIRQMTCIECPVGCKLSVEVENGKAASVSGNKCPKGHAYAVSEVEDPRRIFTSTVLCAGLDLKMLPVKTSAGIPKSMIMEAARAVKKIKVDHPVSLGEVIAENFLNTGTNLVATRPAGSAKKQ